MLDYIKNKPRDALAFVLMTVFVFIGVYSLVPAMEIPTYTVLHNFAGGTSDGYNSANTPIVYNGKLYGMTRAGGTANKGVIYEYDLSTSAYTKLMSFSSSATGSAPWGNLVEKDGKFYGVTKTGGASNLGVMFEYDMCSSTPYSVLHTFNSTVGSGPEGGALIVYNNKFYGLAYGGGTYNKGVLYEYDMASTTPYTRLYNFGGVSGDGYTPRGNLTLVNDIVYGLTYYGGTNDKGTIFSYNLTTGEYNKLYSFGVSVNDGINPRGAVTYYNNKLYGLALFGGASNAGAIFSYDLSSNTYAVLHEFNITDGNQPNGYLTELNGKLYGMTYRGGENQYGVIFSYEPSTNTFARLRSLDDPTGLMPLASLVAYNGKLYGQTSYGGSSNNGVIFEFYTTTVNPPDAPTSITATSSNTQVGLTWGIPSNGGSAITQYNIYNSTDNTLLSTTTDTTKIFTGLTNGTSYSYYLTAKNVAGESASSTIVSATPATVPDAPTINSVTVTVRKAAIDFTIPNSNGSNITSYVAISNPEAITVIGTSSPIEVSNLTSGTPYTFTVSAINSVGTSTPSASSTPVTPRGSSRKIVSAPVSSNTQATTPTTQAPVTENSTPIETVTATTTLNISTSTKPLISTTSIKQTEITKSTIETPTETPKVTYTITPETLTTITKQDLKSGQQTPEVELLQQFLNANGFIISQTGPGSPGHETTYFGKATKSALAKYQKSVGLPATGYFGPMTREVLKNNLHIQ